MPSKKRPLTPADVAGVKEEVVDENPILTTNTNTATYVDSRSPSELLYMFLKQNRMRLKVTVLSDQAPFVGDGFVLTDKPLLKVEAEYIQER